MKLFLHLNTMKIIRQLTLINRVIPIIQAKFRIQKSKKMKKIQKMRKKKRKLKSVTI